MSRLSLFGLALALALTACAPRDQDVTTPQPTPGATTGMPPADGAMTDDPMSDDMDMASGVTAEATLDAAQSAGGLTSLAPTAAVSNIDAWIAQLDGVPAAAPVVANLRTLKSQLQAPTLDGMAIGMTLSELGEQTTAAAGADASLRQLGQALSQAGSALSGM